MLFRSSTGSVFALGDHLLLCGDSTDTTLVREFIGRRKIDCILTDPPYGVAYVESKEGFTERKKSHRAIANDHTQSEDEYRSFTRAWLEAAQPRLAQKNSLYVFNSDRMLFPLRDGMQDAGFRFAQLLVWIKSHAVVGRMDYLLQHELIAYGWHGAHEFRKAKDKSVFFCPKPHRNELHPTMKPVGLLRRLILNGTKVGDIVYDPFGGSGSTLLAAGDLKRRCLMVEIDPEYCRVILERFERRTRVKPEKLSSLSPSNHG